MKENKKKSLKGNRNQPTNSNVTGLQQNLSTSNTSTEVTETYQTQLDEYSKKHSERYQKLKKESQVKSKKERQEAGSNRRLVEKSKTLVEGVRDQTHIHVNPKRGVEACIDIGNIRLSHEVSFQDFTNSFGKLTKGHFFTFNEGLHRCNPAQKHQEAETTPLMGIEPIHALHPKTQPSGLTFGKVVAFAVLCYSGFKILSKIVPPGWNFVFSQLAKEPTVASTTSPETMFDSQQETVTFLRNKEEQNAKKTSF